jgi:hypothetical protein
MNGRIQVSITPATGRRKARSRQARRDDPLTRGEKDRIAPRLIRHSQGCQGGTVRTRTRHPLLDSVGTQGAPSRGAEGRGAHEDADQEGRNI